MRARLLGVAALLLLACSQRPEVHPHPDAAPQERATASPVVAAPPNFLKGQLHCHTDASGDSQTPATAVAAWYADHEYDFIVFTDHNRITGGEGVGDMLVLPGIELTQNPAQCEPPPEAGMQCLLHVNGLFVDADAAAAVAALARPPSANRADLYGHALHVTQTLGGIAMLNHPNFHYAADGALIASLGRRGLALLEVANEAVDSNNAGDKAHPSTEQLWDEALSAGTRVWATATDDAHHYDDAAEVRARGELAFVGDRGWVMVRAARTTAAIKDALRRGDFYASNGVTLQDVRTTGTVLEVELAPTSTATHEVRFIGTGGRVLHRANRTPAAFDLATSDSDYVRAVVEDDQGRKAWTQPLFKSGRRGA